MLCSLEAQLCWCELALTLRTSRTMAQLVIHRLYFLISTRPDPDLLVNESTVKDESIDMCGFRSTVLVWMWRGALPAPKLHREDS